MITPPIPTALGGYAARQGPATGVHDDLHVRSLVFADGAERFGLITCDLLNVDQAMTAHIREAATRATGIPPDRIMVA
ncbi:MAG: hypothetical protein JWN15_2040, partial [Firmicutes bacterium]|nr:hypothetical protein [Bacillota bacterium]